MTNPSSPLTPPFSEYPSPLEPDGSGGLLLQTAGLIGVLLFVQLPEAFRFSQPKSGTFSRRVMFVLAIALVLTALPAGAIAFFAAGLCITASTKAEVPTLY